MRGGQSPTCKSSECMSVCACRVGRIPGSKFEIPFQCPLDHVFDLEGGWHANMNEGESGPNIPYRESSFLNNPSLPAAVNKSQAVVEICPAGTAGCSDGTKPAELQVGGVCMCARVCGGGDAAAG